MAPKSKPSTIHRIRAPIFDHGLWTSILKRPSLVQHVTHLEIKRVLKTRYYPDTEADIVPPGLKAMSSALAEAAELFPPLRGEEGEESKSRRDKRLETMRRGEKALIEALAQGSFKSLRSFTWRTAPPLLDSRTSEGHMIGEGKEEHDVWTALAKGCPNLEELIVGDYAEFTARRPDEFPAHSGKSPQAKFREVFEHVLPIHESSLFDVISGLRHFDYETDTYRHGDDEPPTRQWAAMLLRCPDLEYLRTAFNLYGRRAEYYSGTFDELWDLTPTPTFPHLTTLHLTGLSCSPSNAIDFLARHHQLRSVRAGISVYSPSTPHSAYFGHVGLGGGDLPIGCLPEIEDFAVFGMENAFDALLKDGTPRPNYRPPEHVARLARKGKHQS